MRRNVLAGVCLAVALGLTACQDQRTDPSAPTAGTAAEFRQSTPKVDGSRIKLPSSVRMADQQYAIAPRRAIDPGDYVCPASTALGDFYDAKVTEWATREPEIFDLLYNNLLADLVPTYDAFLFQTEATPQYFGYNGQYNKVMVKTERDTKRFWDIASADIQLIGMHGTMLKDAGRVAATYEAAFGVPAPDAALFAGLVRDGVLASSVLNGGNHPILSFNAFAVTDEGGSIPDKIIMGDGILDAYHSLGYDDVAPQAVYAHEFGHHIQFEKGYFNDPFATTGSQAERTRYTELMADAFSAYYLTHKRGQGMKKQRVAQFLDVFFQIGDCAFASPGHHGTPNQRMAAARFGFNVADQAQKNGHILPSSTFHNLFVAAYPGIVAPDAVHAVALR